MSGNLDMGGNRITSVQRIHNTGEAIHTNTNWQWEGNNISEVGNLTTSNNINIGGDVIGSADIYGGGMSGVQSDDQAASSKAGQGVAYFPWVYTSAIEADGEGGGQSTSIHLGNGSNRTAADEIAFVTNGSNRFIVHTGGNIGVPSGDLIVQGDHAVTSSAGNYDIQKNGTDGNGIINFKT